MGARQSEVKQGRRADELERVAQQDDEAAVVAVCGVAGGQDAEEAGQEERKAGVAERERRVGDLVDLPGDCHGLRLGTENDEQASGLVEAKVARLKGAAGTWGTTGGL